MATENGPFEDVLPIKNGMGIFNCIVSLPECYKSWKNIESTQKVTQQSRPSRQSPEALLLSSIREYRLRDVMGSVGSGWNHLEIFLMFTSVCTRFARPRGENSVDLNTSRPIFVMQ